MDSGETVFNRQNATELRGRSGESGMLKSRNLGKRNASIVGDSWCGAPAAVSDANDEEPSSRARETPTKRQRRRGVALK